MEVHSSPMHGLGCWSEMRGGEGVLDAIRYFGTRGQLFYIHLRDVVGKADNFTEMFLGGGNMSPVETVKTLKEVGFNGFIIDDHVPQMVDDSSWHHRGRAWSTGYIKALIDAVNAADR